MTQPTAPGAPQPAANLNLQGGAAIVAPVSAFPGGVPGNALIVLPLSNPSATMLMLAVFPVPGFEATLGSLGALVAGQTWNDFFSGPASSIGALLDTFGLKSYTTTIDLSGPSVN